MTSGPIYIVLMLIQWEIEQPGKNSALHMQGYSITSS